MQMRCKLPQDWELFRFLLSTLSFEEKVPGLWEKEEFLQDLLFLLQVEEDSEKNTCSFSLFFKRSNGGKSLIYSGFDDSIFNGLLSFQKEYHENKERLLKEWIEKYSREGKKEDAAKDL